MTQDYVDSVLSWKMFSLNRKNRRANTRTKTLFLHVGHIHFLVQASDIIIQLSFKHGRYVGSMDRFHLALILIITFSAFSDHISERWLTYGGRQWIYAFKVCDFRDKTFWPCETEFYEKLLSRGDFFISL